MISAFLICLNEEEQIGYALRSLVAIREHLDIVSVIDNGSTDDTLEIVSGFSDVLPLSIQRVTGTGHHGSLRNYALGNCHGEFVLYLDADETFTNNFDAWLRTGAYRSADIWDFYKYSTIIDRYHYVDGGNGPSTRMFRNLPGVHFPQNVHTYPTHGSLNNKQMAGEVFMFDHTACKSPEALLAKGWRYQQHKGTIGIGPTDEYINRVEAANAGSSIREFDSNMKRIIEWGP